MPRTALFNPPKFAAKKGDFVLVSVTHSSTLLHGARTAEASWEPGVVAKAVQGDVQKAFMGLGSAAVDVSRLPRQIVAARDIPGGDAHALVKAIREITGEDYPSWPSLVEAKPVILEAMKRLGGGNPPRRVRVTRQRRTARGRVAGRPLRNSAESDRKPMRAFTLSGVRVEWFQGYAEDVRYLRASDGKKYSHVVETDAAELYLCSHPEFGHCLLIVDPSGRTPLWK